MVSFAKLLQAQFPKIAAILLLVALLLIAAVPGYVSGGRWSWKQPPPVTVLGQIKQLRSSGLTVPGWRTTEQRQLPLGEHKWSVQEIQQDSADSTREPRKAFLLLLPQNGPADQPQVEWTDINGWQRWEVAQEKQRQFIAQSSLGSSDIEARFFRGSTKQQTFAVLQWYAWPTGGHPAPIRWFWLDQLAQWRNTRVPWVAVSIMIPMEPLGNAEQSWSVAESLGKTVQAELMAGPFVKR